MCSSSRHHPRLKPTLAFIYRTVYTVILQNAIKFMHDIILNMHILTQVIQDFSLSICSGQTVAIVGPSGGGKPHLQHRYKDFMMLTKERYMH